MKVSANIYLISLFTSKREFCLEVAGTMWPAKRDNIIYSYTLLGSKLSATTKERDAGVILDTSVKTSPQCAIVDKK